MKVQLLLILCAVLLIIPRFWQLDIMPQSLNRDEAALAYNGYLLSSVGQDEWGKHWPISLESFGDFKLIGYPTVLALLFKFAPLTDFWVRIPSALSGIGLIFASYWFARTLRLRKSSAMLLAGMVAITPVFIFYSRVAFEANMALTLFVLSLTALFDDIKNPRFFKKTITLACYLAAVLTYNSPLLLGLLLLPIIVFAYGYQNWKRWLPVFSGWLIISVAALFVLQPVFAQKQNITLFSDEASVLAFNEYRSSLPASLQRIAGNKLLYFAPQIMRNVYRSFSPRFLVTQGGAHPWHSLPNWGHIYWWQYGLALAGLVIAARRYVLLLLLLGISLVPSSITTDAPHATRSLLFFFLLIVLAAVAFERVSTLLGKKAWLLLFIIASVSIVRFTYSYFGEYKNDQLMFQPGFSQVITEVKQKYPNERVAIIDGGGYQYILTAWYAQLTPSEYFSTVVRQAPNQIGFRYGERVGQFHFIAHAADRVPEETVLIEWTGLRWAITKY
ncbi:MAG: hypothetical protein GW947_02490 [Candidatus Pacebacteria bacterium]|nr:hypothetical protein [Candidatus Paceibacterota bacterium]PIR61015.1 MAG: hypothetical protein COU68_01680 [Candidatus Pacebacteria bacterium CG10_big_fil_rev_8_21_14_0_10_45_6]